MTTDGLSRRAFLKVTGGVLGAAATPKLFAQAKTPPAPAPSSKVIDVRNTAWRKEDGQIDAAMVRNMIGNGMKRLTGKHSEDDAWRTFVAPGETVALKFNIVSQDYTRANQALVDAITDALMSIGVQRKRIIVVEANPATFKGGTPDLHFGKPVKIHDKQTRFTNFITRQVDCVINLPNIKDHRLAGITGAMKNISHAAKTFVEGPSNFHAHRCDPYIPEVLSQGEIREKIRLNISNGLLAVFDGGPSGRKPQLQWKHNGLLFSADPVAIDRVALELIETTRKAKGRPSLFKTRRQPTHIFTAAQMGIGEADIRRIDWIKMIA